ncbi:MAG: heme-binding protein [Betaproteobacteria bacterium]|jgi:hypothetical protein|nr:heme-binding protein [Betaproteobacteria bacterium]
MTAPVEQNQVNGTWAINFTMPSEYTLKTLPKPNNTAVILSALPSQTFITIQFSGRSSIENISTHESKLKAFVIKNNIKIQDDPIYAFYNPPWTLPILRRNEVMFKVDKN